MDEYPPWPRAAALLEAALPGETHVEEAHATTTRMTWKIVGDAAPGPLAAALSTVADVSVRRTGPNMWTIRLDLRGAGRSTAVWTTPALVEAVGRARRHSGQTTAEILSEALTAYEPVARLDAEQ